MSYKKGYKMSKAEDRLDSVFKEYGRLQFAFNGLLDAMYGAQNALFYDNDDCEGMVNAAAETILDKGIKEAEDLTGMHGLDDVEARQDMETALCTAAHVLREIPSNDKDWYRKMWNPIEQIQKSVRREKERQK